MSDTIPGIISTAEEIKKFIKQYDKNDNTKTVEIPKEIFDKCCKEWKYKLRLGKEPIFLLQISHKYWERMIFLLLSQEILFFCKQKKLLSWMKTLWGL